MADVAKTAIRHGNEDGTIVEIAEGQPIKGLPKAVVDDLKEQGLVGPAAPTQEEVDAAAQEKEDLLAEIEELKAKLAEKSDTPASAPVTAAAAKSGN